MTYLASCDTCSRQLPLSDGWFRLVCIGAGMPERMFCSAACLCRWVGTLEPEPHHANPVSIVPEARR